MLLAHPIRIQLANGFEQNGIIKLVSYSLDNSPSMPQAQHMVAIWLGIGTG
jgi:hypothetical protein